MIARPKARWATRLLVPGAVLLATGGLLAYAARDAIQPRLEVYVAATIPKEEEEVVAPVVAVADKKGAKPKKNEKQNQK